MLKNDKDLSDGEEDELKRARLLFSSPGAKRPGFPALPTRASQEVGRAPEPGAARDRNDVDARKANSPCCKL